MDDYMIPYYGLSNGIHEFDFEAGDKFFEHFENADILGGKLEIHLILDKKPGFMELDLDMKGYLRVVCDRCLDDFDFSIRSDQKLFVRFGDISEEQSDNVIVIPREETRLNIAQYIYEFAALSLPVQKLHPEDAAGNTKCNKKMIGKLEQLKSRNENEIDPRWEALLKLKNNN